MAVLGLTNLIVCGYNIYRTKNTEQSFDVAKHTFYSCNHNGFKPVWLVTYGAGLVHQANQKALVISSIDKCIDAIKIYTPELLGVDFLTKNRTIMEKKRGAGYWLWKPYIILDTLKHVPENDLVIYIDSGITMKKPLDLLINKFAGFLLQIFPILKTTFL